MKRSNGMGGAAPPEVERAEACATLGCKQPAALTYLSRPRCQTCYEEEVADGEEVNSEETPNHEETTMAKVKKTTGKSAKSATKAPKAAKRAGAGPKQQPKAAKPKSATKPNAAKPAADAKPKGMSALDAAATVLKTGGPMNAKTMIAAMAEHGLWTSPNGKTPHATLYAAILREINAKGGQARFRKAERGQFEYAG